MERAFRALFGPSFFGPSARRRADPEDACWPLYLGVLMSSSTPKDGEDLPRSDCLLRGRSGVETLGKTPIKSMGKEPWIFVGGALLWTTDDLIHLDSTNNPQIMWITTLRNPIGILRNPQSPQPLLQRLDPL